MVQAIKSTRGVRERPVKGKAVVLEARFNIIAEVANSFTAAQIKIIVTQGTKRDIKEIIKKGIRREYKKSGLRRLSGKLFRAAQNFKVDVRVKGKNVILVTARWDPSLAYFFAHLFGVKIRITDKMRAFVHANDIIHPRDATKFVKIPRRNFLAFDKKTRAEISKNVFNRRFNVALKAKREKEKKIEAVPRRGKNISRFRGRRMEEAARRRRVGRVAAVR